MPLRSLTAGLRSPIPERSVLTDALEDYCCFSVQSRNHSLNEGESGGRTENFRSHARHELTWGKPLRMCAHIIADPRDDVAPATC